MKSDFLANLTSEERQAIFKAAREERERTIQDAIKNGATVQYMTSRLSLDEQETYISMDNEGNCIIDTSIQSDINRCIKRGWKIIHVTWCKWYW